ncbi:hypothetical protein CFPU101_16840 [Chroococcus sp. FPU101]|nr:hypothetical protein CFPU101_16840 [Chroococcus sp. FPU101]
MNEKFPYGVCHACNKAISILGFEAYYCSSCLKWHNYPERVKVNLYLPTEKKTKHTKIVSHEQSSIWAGGES